MGRGIEPRLIPDIQSGGTQLLDKIRQLPTTLDDCIRNLIATITAIRLAVQQAAVQAGRVGLAVLGDALLAIGEALAALGSRLVNMLLIINMDKMLEQIFPSRTVA